MRVGFYSGQIDIFADEHEDSNRDCLPDASVNRLDFNI